MERSPLYQDIVEEAQREGEIEALQRTILKFLVRRFGPAAVDLEVELKAVAFDRLDDLVDAAASCRSLASFRKRLES